MDQAVLEFQVISNKRLPTIRAGRNLIVFCFRKEMEAVTAGIEGWKTDTGTMKISSVALTALDLLRYPQASGGIDNVATILSDVSLGVEKSRLAVRVESRSGTLVDLYRSLVRINSIYPPGDTIAVVEAIEAVLNATPGIEHRRVVGRAPAVNLVARTRRAGAGRRLVLNGHLDTFPIGQARWSHPPLGADLEDGRIYGRGARDMKAGVAALVLAFVTLTEFRDAWSGEVVLALVGDEETGGRWGTQYLLANVEEAVGERRVNQTVLPIRTTPSFARMWPALGRRVLKQCRFASMANTEW